MCRTKRIAVALVGLLASLVFSASVTAQGNAPAVPVVTIAVEAPFDGFGLFLQIDDGNVEVIDVYEGTPADLAGVEVGDVLLSVGGSSLAGATEETLRAALDAAGTRADFTIQRDGATLSISITRGRVVPNRAALDWDDVAGAAHYELWLWESVGGWERLDDGSLSDSSARIWDLQRGVLYYVTVRAVDSEGVKSGWSEYVSATIAAQPGATAQATATPTPTATAGSITFCVLVEYSAADAEFPTIHVPLIQNETLLAYRNAYGENLDDLEIVGVIYRSDGSVGIGYLDDRNDRMVYEFFSACTFTHHSAWFDVE